MKIKACLFKILAIAVLSFSFPTTTHAFDWVSLGSALIGSSLQRAIVPRQIKYYDTDGREKLFESYKNSMAAKNDRELNTRLSNIVERLSLTIAKSDVSIIDRPYNYFIVPEKSFNAACGLGHTMMVNDSVFSFLNNNDDQIAAVIAHEMVHGQRDHNLKGINKQLNVMFARNLIASQIGDYGSYVLLNIATAHAVTIGITKPIEWEADNLSYAYLTDSGYNPGAPASVWQRISASKEMKDNNNFFIKVLNPSTHPKTLDRRDNFSLKLTEHSKNNVAVNAATAEITIRGQSFMIPADMENIGGLERSYLIAGNLAALYSSGQPLEPATVRDGSLYIGDKRILTPTDKDPHPQELATILNNIK